MENLKIFDGAGNNVLDRDLADEKGPLLLVTQGEGLALVEAAEHGETILGALVRSEDGWTLASSDPAQAVVSGPKSAASLPLLAGAASMLGGFVFRLESNIATSGNVLLWRIGKSPIAAENVVAGRNVVATDSLRNGAVSVNPAVPGEVLCEFYPTLIGLDVVVSDGGRLSVPLRALFSVGSFEGLLLPAAEAAKAIKSGDPFGYPSRGIRMRLMFGLLLAGVVFLGGAGLYREAESVAKLADMPRGAVREESARKQIDNTYATDTYFYLLSFYRELPRVLGAEPSPIAADLLARTPALEGDPRVKRTISFLRTVTAVQETVRANRWNELPPILEDADVAMFEETRATAFLRDAKVLSTCLNERLPALAREMLTASADCRRELSAQVDEVLAEMTNNVFGVSRNVRGRCEIAKSRCNEILAYTESRDLLLSNPEALSIAEVSELDQAFADLERELSEEAYLPILDSQRQTLANFAEKSIEGLLTLSGESSAVTGQLVAIGPLCNLAENVGVDEAKVKVWREKARRVNRALDAWYREKYQAYRLTVGNDPAEADKILNEMLSVGGGNGAFGKWARKEKDSREAEKETAK